MATILNSNTDTNIFHDYHPSHFDTEHKNAPIMNLGSDAGSMTEQLEESMTKIIEVGKKTINKAAKKKKVYQWNTKNKSFIEVHNDLKKLGVENNKFFLRIYDETLMDIDPYAMVLPVEIQARIILECIRNPWYFLREICRIPVDGMPICPGGGVPFKADRNNIATWYCFLNGIDHYSSKPRQQGKTQDALAKCNYAYHFGSLSSTILLANRDFTLNKMNLSRIKTQRDLLPLYLQMKVSINNETVKIEKEQSNVLSMTNPVNHNKIQLLPSANQDGKAQGVGRGYTASIIMYDEFDWMANNIAVRDATAFTFRKAADVAAANGSLYGRIFTSTPGNMDTKEGQDAEAFINGKSKDNINTPPMLKWVDKYFDTPIQKLKQIVFSKAYNRIVFIEHSWQQLKCGNDWFEKACQDVGFDPEQIAREILLKRLRGSKRSPFSRQQLMTIINGVETPIGQLDLNDQLDQVYIYETLNRKTPYIMSIDPADGLSGDNLAMVLINPYTEKIAAEFASPDINQTRMSKLLVKFMNKHCPKCMIVVENNKGRELINQLMLTKYASQLWYDIDKLDKRETINTRDINFDQERALGFNTSPKTRPLIMGVIEDLVKNEPEKVNGKLTVDDVCALERNPKTNKVAAANGKHDDVIMAFGIGHTVLRSATNLDNWDIIRGMPPPVVIDKDDPAYKKTMLMSVMEYLPDDVRAALLKGMKKSEDMDVDRNRRAIMKEAAMLDVQEKSRRAMYDDDVEMDEDNEFTQEAMADQWNQMVDYNPDAGFDLGDYF